LLGPARLTVEGSPARPLSPLEFAVLAATGYVRMSDLFDLSGRVALVTGASQGLGRRFAEVLAAHGAAVGLAARQIDRLADLRAELDGAGRAVASVMLDVTDTAAIEAAIESIEAALGPVDILVNNAGVAVAKGVLEQTEADWDRVLDTDLKGAFFTAQAVARRMAARTQRPPWGGNIINIASLIALKVVGHLAPYAAAKSGLAQITKAMALELARHDIRVNALAPGYIETDINCTFLASEAGERLRKQIPQRRFGTPADLDGALLLLASDASRYMTGSIIVIDGGLLLA
jgi:NAD(P)-dependent dehydrogenase (short-subunit alcohol dehydrogenase family)